LPDAVRGKMEAALRSDFSNVRVHVGPQAQRIGAIAFTVGSDIYFAPGRYQPDTIQGQQLLGHELAHVVQQRANRVRNPLNTELAVVQDDALEAEADRLGRHAASFRAYGRSATGNGTMQRFAGARILSLHNARLSHRRRHGVMQRMMVGENEGVDVDVLAEGGFITEGVFAGDDVPESDLTEIKGDEVSSRQSSGKGREAKIVELMDEKIAEKKMREDVMSVLDKVQRWAQGNDRDAVIREAGRDLIFYNKSAYARRWATEERSAEYQLVHWNAAKEPTGDTVAMLMDFALAWKHTYVDQKSQLARYAEEYAKRRTEWRQTDQYLEEKGLEKPLSGEELERKEVNSQRVVTRAHEAGQGKDKRADKGFNRNSALYSLKERKKYQISAGPSSSTASLLWFLRRVGTITQTEAKSVTRALTTEFWGKGAKNWSGEYHTQFEATIPLARHLSKFKREAGAQWEHKGEIWEEIEI
jgi:hypothetical protein